MPKHIPIKIIHVLEAEPSVGMISIDPGLDSLFVNKTQDIVLTKEISISNTCNEDEVLLEISIRNFQN